MCQFDKAANASYYAIHIHVYAYTRIVMSKLMLVKPGEYDKD